jgi:hypothetical protein
VLLYVAPHWFNFTATKKVFFGLVVWLILCLVLWFRFREYLLRAVVRAAAEALIVARADQRRHAQVLAAPDRGRRHDVERLMAHGVLARLQGGLLAHRLAALVLLRDRQELDQLLLGQTERVVVHVERLLVDTEAPHHRVHVRLARQGIVPADARREVRAEEEREARRQIGVLEDAIDLHRLVDRHGLLHPAIKAVLVDPEGALPAVGLDELLLVVLLAEVVEEISVRHVGLPLLEALQGLVVVDRLPGEEVHHELRVLALAQLRHDLVLTLLEHVHELLCQEVGVGQNALLLLLALLLLVELHQLALARGHQLVHERRVLELREEGRLLGGERVGEGRGHCCWLLVGEREEVCLTWAAAAVQFYLSI